MGDGTNIWALDDLWVPGRGLLRHSMLDENAVTTPMLVSDLIDGSHGSNRWNVHLFARLFPAAVVQEILSIPMGLRDIRCW